MTGVDSNSNNFLDTAEVTSTSYICNGSAGASGKSGTNVLLTNTIESPGTNCPSGGRKITAGEDLNANNILDVSEITSTAYVCNGSNGTNGTSGNNGLSTLFAVVTEPVGAHCPSAGLKMTSGLDSNANNMLDPAEVTATSYVCNGSPGLNGTNGLSSLNATASEPPGLNCVTGGTNLTTGVDTNSNGVLDSNEITSTTYICNGAVGATGPAGPAGAGITWVNVTSTAQQAVANTGYLANNSAQVTITLPLYPAVGDIVQVTGVGTGGWKVAQNANQVVKTKNLPGAIGAIWTPHANNQLWDAVASSWDGTHLVAAVNGGPLYISSDSGLNWSVRETNRAWWSVASSTDGSKLVAVVKGGQIYTSTDGGQVWVPRESARQWWSVASSADGTNLVAAVQGGQLYTSTDSGVTWIARESARTWYSVASSMDGLNLVAVVQNGQIFTSTDGGINWIARESTRSWQSVASSADGSKLVAAVSLGQLYVSNDSGATWTPRESSRLWDSVTTSWDGNNILAVEIGGKIYSSTDGGLSFVPRDSARSWQAVASSWDGVKLVAVDYGGRIYTAQSSAIPNTTVGITGSISGAQYDAIDLQCIGNNTFTVLSYSGALSVQ
jgi:hypothetical protein